MTASRSKETMTENTSKSSGQTTPEVKRSGMESSRAVTTGRILFLLCLLAVAGVLSTVFFFVLKQSETELAEGQYDSIADRALDTAFRIAKRKRLGTITMASSAGNANPNADDWPFVTIYGYEDTATKLINATAGRSMGFAPLVTPDQLEAFEAFAYKYYYEDRGPPFPNTTAVSPFGRGVWGVDGERKKYHETDGSTDYNSPNKIFAPILQHSDGAHAALMINLRFEKTRGTAIDNIIDCSNKLADKPDAECGAITDVLFLTSQEVEPGPAALIMQPIYPGKNSTVLTGILASSIIWDEVLVDVFSSEVSGIECLLETESKVYTYDISGGIARLKGEGHFHGECTPKYLRQISLTGDGLFSGTSAKYTLSICPTEEFFECYRTINPAVAAFGAAMCIFVTSLLFVLYDSYVRKEFNTKIELLEAKRKFVRFVSHEVRTPLNSVCMGLSLMLEEIGAALGPHLNDGKILRTRKVDKENATEWLHLTREVMTNAQSSVDVLNDLLNYDKIEMGTLSLEYTVIPIWKLIEVTVSEFKLPAAAKAIAFSVEYTPSDPEVGNQIGAMSDHLSQDLKKMKVVGDTVRVTQVLRNLLSNALKFTKEGGKLNVRVSQKEAEEKPNTTRTFTLKRGNEVEVPLCGTIQVAVTDTGAGMSGEQLAELFRDGVQFNVNDLQSGQGSGLGLYIAKGIVDQHGGKLTAYSKGIGHGTTFTMTLPLFLIPDKTPKTEEPYQNSGAATTGSIQVENKEVLSSYLRILVVDDAPTNRKLLRRLLENHGHSITEAEDGLDAVQKMQEGRSDGKPFDSILLDYEMPHMNGPDSCRKMREMGCDSFIVGVTGNVMAQDVTYFKECGANGVLAKPFRLAELDQMLLEYGVLGSHPSDGIENLGDGGK